MQYQATSSLTLMIQKSMVIPPSPMILYNYHYIGGLLAPIARRHFVYCNIHQICSSMLFFLFQKLTWLTKKYTVWSNGQRYSFMAIQLNKGAQKGNHHESRKGTFLIQRYIYLQRYCSNKHLTGRPKPCLRNCRLSFHTQPPFNKSFMNFSQKWNINTGCLKKLPLVVLFKLEHHISRSMSNATQICWSKYVGYFKLFWSKIR